MDIRIIKTKNSIINAFIELRAKKEIERITVKELCEKAMINKSTFYSHYTDIYDLSEQLENRIATEIVANLKHPEHSFQEAGQACFFTELKTAFRKLFSGFALITGIMRLQTLF